MWDWGHGQGQEYWSQDHVPEGQALLGLGEWVVTLTMLWFAASVMATRYQLL